MRSGSWQIVNTINAHTDPLFKSLKLLKIKDIFDVQCMKFWYKFVNNNVPTYFASMFRYNHELYDIQTRNHERLHRYPFRTTNANNARRRRIPELLCKFPTAVLEKARTHSIMSFTSHVKFHLNDSYCSGCVIPQCYYVQGQRRNIIHLYQQRHLPSWN